MTRALSVRSQLTLPGGTSAAIPHLRLLPTYTQQGVELSSNVHAASEHKDDRGLVASLATSVPRKQFSFPVT